MLNHEHSHLPLDAGIPRAATRQLQQRRLLWTLALTLAFAGVEVLGGLLSGSLALLADAGHMGADSLALMLSLAAVWLSGRRASSTRTYGLRRVELLAAVVNATLLVLISVWIVLEAVERLYHPHAVQAGLMFWVAVAGVVINLVALGLLRGPAQADLNIRAALWHVTGDLLGSGGAVVAALVLRLTGWLPVDPLLGLCIAAIIGISGGKILLDSVNLLLDSVPKQIDPGEVKHFMADLPEVREICDLHIWAVSSTETLLTAHLVVSPGIDRDRFQHDLLQALHDRFHLAHMTVQLECNPQNTCPPGW